MTKAGPWGETNVHVWYRRTPPKFLGIFLARSEALDRALAVRPASGGTNGKVCLAGRRRFATHLLQEPSEPASRLLAEDSTGPPTPGRYGVRSVISIRW